jgi:hypothetical protein
MRSEIVAGCLVIASLTPFWLHQEQAKPPVQANAAVGQVQNPPAAQQNPPAAARPKSNPVPDKFVNLMVLPKEITKGKLVDMMKQFAITFGVRCSYCHAVSDDLTEGSFDSDEKPTKVKARELIKKILEMKAEDSGRG